MKRTHKEIRKVILEILSDGKEHSYGNLERTVNTNWITIREHIDDLLLFGMVDLSKDKKFKITLQGRELLKKL